MTTRQIIREFRRRWPAIRSILRDGTVIYRGSLEDGVIVVRRDNSCVMDTRMIRTPLQFAPPSSEILRQIVGFTPDGPTPQGTTR